MANKLLGAIKARLSKLIVQQEDVVGVDASEASDRRPHDDDDRDLDSERRFAGCHVDHDTGRLGSGERTVGPEENAPDVGRKPDNRNRDVAGGGNIGRAVRGEPIGTSILPSA